MMDLPPGYSYQPTQESLIESLIKIHRGESLTDCRIYKKDLFRSHPALVIKKYELPPCKRDTRNYYYFYSEVPDTSYDKYGYGKIKDKSNMGVWEATSISYVFRCNISGGRGFGETQSFRYTLANGNITTWLMVIYGLPHAEVDKTEHIETSQLKRVICEVYETDDSDTAKAVRKEASMKISLVKSVNMGEAYAAKLEEIDEVRQVLEAGYKECKQNISSNTKAHAKSLIERDNAENKEANALLFGQRVESSARKFFKIHRETFGK